MKQMISLFLQCPRLGEVVIEANGVTKAYGDKLYENLSFKLPAGGIVGVIEA